ncbi:hypothetical protein Dsin_024671 [Dipteronia sinensis]|uniref:E3 ubiquitin-protein ligase PRT1 n=1 Tax=Dipteronia sinensis TaxID=43782 RepID=A0AAD9ZUM1_9ROSI|nr:hypothetical protein Dsin_024671 [Dipteronia sinensis]
MKKVAALSSSIDEGGLMKEVVALSSSNEGGRMKEVAALSRFLLSARFNSGAGFQRRGQWDLNNSRFRSRVRTMGFEMERISDRLDGFVALETMEKSTEGEDDNGTEGEEDKEEEKTMGSFSQQFDSHSFDESTGEGGIHENNGTTFPVQTSGGTVTIMEKNSPQNKLNGNRKQIAVTDVLCSACKQLLIHPVALNCGHVYCETCIIKQTNEKIKCQICLCLNPNGCPKVCLEIDHLLEEQFFKEYALREDAIQPNKVQSNSGKLGFNASFLSTGEQLPMWADPRSKIHFGAGCDYCGMYPIIGDRYKCKDCMEAMGFDLCGDCYNTRSKLPGRFNQKHTQEHKLELVKPIVIRNVMRGLVTGLLEDGSSALILAHDIFANGSPVTLPSDDVQPQENTSNTDNIIDENESEPAS